MSSTQKLPQPPSTKGGWSVSTKPEEPANRSGVDDLVGAFPSHIPIGLPLPLKPSKHDKPDAEYSL